MTPELTETDIYGCIDCHKLSFIYMVHNLVWLEAIPNYFSLKKERKKKGLYTSLCLDCLSSRIGRLLTINDFQNVPANDHIRFGFRMGFKLGFGLES